MCLAGIDYKQLTDRHCDPLDVIRPVLSHDNFSAIAKLAPHIHDKVVVAAAFLLFVVFFVEICS